MIDMLHNRIDPSQHLFNTLYQIERKAFKGKGRIARYEEAQRLIRDSNLALNIWGQKSAMQRLEQVKAIMLLQDVKDLMVNPKLPYAF
jgi:hypothetical protein